MTPLDLWKSLVDSFAKLHDGAHYQWVVTDASYPRGPGNQQVNRLLAILTDEQRKILAGMLIDARRGGVHDALVTLNDRIALNSGTYSEHGVVMEFQPFGSELYYDYVSRKEGDAWPDADA